MWAIRIHGARLCRQHWAKRSVSESLGGDLIPKSKANAVNASVEGTIVGVVSSVAQGGEGGLVRVTTGGLTLCERNGAGCKGVTQATR